MKQVLFGSGASFASADHAPLVGANVNPGTEASARAPWPAAGVLRHLVVELATAPGAGTSRAFTLRVNGANTALTVTISDTATTARLTGTDVSIAAGDLVTLQCVNTGSPASSNVRWSLEFEGSTAKQSGYALPIGSASNTTSPRYAGLFATLPATFATATTNVANLVAAAGTLTSLRAAVNTAPGASNGFTFYVNLNGTRQDGSGATVNTACALVGAITSASATFSLALASGDLVYVEAVVSGTFTTRNWSLGAAFTATTDGQSQLCGSTGTTTLSTTATQYIPAAGLGTVGSTETTFTIRHLGGVTSVQLSGFRALLGTAPGSGKNRLLDLRKNATSPGPTMTIADAATTGSDLSNTGTIADGDLWNLRTVPTSTPAASTAAWAFIASPASTTVECSETFLWMPV